MVWEARIPQDAVTIFSGGTEGVLSPHITFVVRAEHDTGLVGTVGHTRAFAPHEVGSSEQGRQVAETVTKMMREGSIEAQDVHLVLVKCPLLTSAKLEAIRAQRQKPTTTDTYDSMARSRYASALGIAAALGEMPEDGIEPQMVSEEAWSSRASCSSGAELEDCHILILASAPVCGPKSGESLNIVSKHMEDAMDAKAVLELLEKVKSARGKVVQVFAKAEADPQGHVRGFRHTMNTDSDIHSTRHARAEIGRAHV